MGYTHYWKQTRNLKVAEMKEICEAARKIIAGSGVEICGWDGTGTRELTSETIGFNGCDDDGHETFRINAKRGRMYDGAPMGFAFCKTASKPYDIVVVALLAVLAADYGFDVSSDGGVGDWDDGVRLACKAMEKVYRNPIRKEAA